MLCVSAGRCSGAEVTIPDCAYMDSLGTNFWHGANFKTGGSSILPGGYSPFHLGIQISQFKQFKSRTTASLSSPLSLTGSSDPWKHNILWVINVYLTTSRRLT